VRLAAGLTEGVHGPGGLGNQVAARGAASTPVGQSVRSHQTPPNGGTLT